MPEKIAFSVDEVAHAVGCNPKTIRKGISDGQIPSFGIGRLIRIPAWWVKQQSQNSADAPSGKAA